MTDSKFPIVMRYYPDKETPDAYLLVLVYKFEFKSCGVVALCWLLSECTWKVLAVDHLRPDISNKQSLME